MQEVKKGTFEDEAIWMEIQRQIENRESLNESDCEIEVANQKTRFSINTSNSQEFKFKSNWKHASGKLDSVAQEQLEAQHSAGLKTISTEMRSNDIASFIVGKAFVRPSPNNISDDDSPKCAATQKTSDKSEHIQPVSDKDNLRGMLCEITGTRSLQPSDAVQNLLGTIISLLN